MVKRAPLALLAGLALYLFMAFAGIRYGLPDEQHTMSYNCDEYTWIEGIASLNPRQGKFNPYPNLKVPSMYLWMYGATLAVGQAVGWIPPNNGKEWFRTHPDQWARFYLAGRYLQVLCGVLLLLALWLVSRRVFNDYVASVAVLLCATMPSLVAASHFHQASLPVAMFGMISLGFIFGARREFSGHRWLWAAAFFAAIAVSTKFSALALSFPLAYAAYRVGWRPKALMGAFAFGFFGLFIGIPWAFLSPNTFAAVLRHAGQQPTPVSNWLSTLHFPFTVYSNALGPALGFACLIGVAATVFRKLTSAEKVLLIWTGAFYMGTVKAGLLAASARVLIGMPALVLLLAVALNSWRERCTRKGLVSCTAAGLLVLTVVPSMAIVSLRRSTPIQKQASAWIDANIPTSKSIGIPREIFWWTPDTIYHSAHHPERLTNPYEISELGFSKAIGETAKPDFIVDSAYERSHCPDEKGVTEAQCREFYSWLEDPKNYEVVEVFKRKVSFLGWTWDRPEITRSFDDDLWATDVTIRGRVGG